MYCWRLKIPHILLALRGTFYCNTKACQSNSIIKSGQVFKNIECFVSGQLLKWQLKFLLWHPQLPDGWWDKLKNKTRKASEEWLHLETELILNTNKIKNAAEHQTKKGNFWFRKFSLLTKKTEEQYQLLEYIRTEQLSFLYLQYNCYTDSPTNSYCLRQHYRILLKPTKEQQQSSSHALNLHLSSAATWLKFL